MDDPSSNAVSPGFRSLAQAGIHLTQGEELPEGQGNLRSAEWLEAMPRDPEWPPLPTLAPQEACGKTDCPADHPTLQASRVHLQPRGLRRTHPAHAPLGQVVTTPPLQFTCPCCGTVLSITHPASYRGQPGPCPHCLAVIVPPRMLSPFTIAQLPDSEHGDFI